MLTMRVCNEGISSSPDRGARAEKATGKRVQHAWGFGAGAAASAAAAAAWADAGSSTTASTAATATAVAVQAISRYMDDICSKPAVSSTPATSCQYCICQGYRKDWISVPMPTETSVGIPTESPYPQNPEILHTHTSHCVFLLDAFLNKHIYAIHITVLFCAFNNDNEEKMLQTHTQPFNGPLSGPLPEGTFTHSHQDKGSLNGCVCVCEFWRVLVIERQAWLHCCCWWCLEVHRLSADDRYRPIDNRHRLIISRLLYLLLNFILFPLQLFLYIITNLWHTN